MRFKLGMLIGAGVSYLATSGKGKELINQLKNQTQGGGQSGSSGQSGSTWSSSSGMSGTSSTPSTSGMSGTSGFSTPGSTSTPSSVAAGSPGSLTSAMDAGPAPDAYGAAVVGNSAALDAALESDELGSAR